MTENNTALWRQKRGGPSELGPAPYTHPTDDEVVVRVCAVAVNPIDALPGFAYRVVLPWVKFPTIIGTDVAGEVVEVGPNVTRLAVGDRVLGHATGLEKNRNRSAEGAFQHYVVMMAHMVSKVPDALGFEQASVLPLALSTAACGLFEPEQLGLALPQVGAAERGETVIVWGGSTSVGSNAIQLARGAGYRVLATASPANFDYVRSLGADAGVDRTSATAVPELVAALGDSPLAGTMAIGAGSLSPALALASAVPGSRRITTAMPGPRERIQKRLARRRGIHIGLIWGGSLKDNAVGPAMYVDFLPAALAAGTYQAAPEADVVGDGLTQIPVAIDRLRAGVSARKLVVRV